MGKLLQFPGKTKADLCTAEALYIKALEAVFKGEDEEAEVLYRRVVELDPNMKSAWLNRGSILLNSKFYNLTEAERCFRRTLEIDPEYAMAHYNLGCCLDEQRELEKAVECYCAALKLDPLYTDAHFNIASAYERLDQKGKAFGHWKLYCQYTKGSKPDSAFLYAQRRMHYWKNRLEQPEDTNMSHDH